MTGQKYPADIVEKVAKAILDNFNPPDEGHSSWWINPDVSAVAALDALGLTVTEEWSTLHSSGAALPARSRAGARTRSTALGQPILHRTVLHAKTPWVEVPDDAD